MRGRVRVREHNGDPELFDRGPFLPEGPGDAESPEELRALEVYNARIQRFVQVLEPSKRRRRHYLGDYSTKNCEEAWGNRS